MNRYQIQPLSLSFSHYIVSRVASEWNWRSHMCEWRIFKMMESLLKWDHKCILTRLTLRQRQRQREAKQRNKNVNVGVGPNNAGTLSIPHPPILTLPFEFSLGVGLNPFWTNHFASVSSKFSQPFSQKPNKPTKMH